MKSSQRPSSKTLKKISEAIAFWFMRAEQEVYETTARPVASKALKQKYAVLQTKINTGSAASLSDGGEI